MYNVLQYSVCYKTIHSVTVVYTVFKMYTQLYIKMKKCHKNLEPVFLMPPYSSTSIVYCLFVSCIVLQYVYFIKCMWDLLFVKIMLT